MVKCEFCVNLVKTDEHSGYCSVLGIEIPNTFEERNCDFYLELGTAGLFGFE